MSFRRPTKHTSNYNTSPSVFTKYFANIFEPSTFRSKSPFCRYMWLPNMFGQFWNVCCPRLLWDWGGPWKILPLIWCEGPAVVRWMFCWSRYLRIEIIKYPQIVTLAFTCRYSFNFNLQMIGQNQHVPWRWVRAAITMLLRKVAGSKVSFEDVQKCMPQLSACQHLTHLDQNRCKPMWRQVDLMTPQHNKVSCKHQYWLINISDSFSPWSHLQFTSNKKGTQNWDEGWSLSAGWNLKIWRSCRSCGLYHLVTS